MTLFLSILALGVCLAFSALFSGSETAFYTLSRVQLELDAKRGSRVARLASWLLRDDAALLITILIGNNLALELSTHLAEHLLADGGMSLAQVALLVTAVLTPLVFLFGEVLPKEIFRRRPHGLIGIAAPVVATTRVLAWPLERLLRALSWLIERALGVNARPEQLRPGRGEVLRFLEEGRRVGALSPKAETLARNALALRSLPVSRVMIPWDQVVTLPADGEQVDLFRRTSEARFTRLPVVEASGAVSGYVHQIDVLAEGPEVPVLEARLDVTCLPAGTSVARALLLLRGSGRRAAVVGSEEAPEGLVTLKDLVEEISGELTGL